MPHDKLVAKPALDCRWFLATQRESADFAIAHYTFQSFPLSASADDCHILHKMLNYPVQ